MRAGSSVRRKLASYMGGHDSRGREMHALDMNEVENAAKHCCQEVEAIVVSSFFGVLNPSHEERVRDVIRTNSSLPVVTGHELTSELGILERTTTAVLNAKLLPIIDDFLSGVEKSLALRQVRAPIMVFKGNSSFMNLAKARMRPVEIILSGPAASLMGGKQLSKLDKCIVLDIGGTSTDIAYLDNGFARLQKEGAIVGQWRTRVKAVDIWTTALGEIPDSISLTGTSPLVPIECCRLRLPVSNSLLYLTRCEVFIKQSFLLLLIANLIDLLVGNRRYLIAYGRTVRSLWQR